MSATTSFAVDADRAAARYVVVHRAVNAEVGRIIAERRVGDSWEAEVQRATQLARLVRMRQAAHPANQTGRRQ